jgi:hypothetical protein
MTRNKGSSIEYLYIPDCKADSSKMSLLKS